MTVTQEYYHLKGIPRTAEDALYACSRQGSRFKSYASGSKTTLLVKITSYAASIFLFLLSIPLSATASLVRLTFQEKIDGNFFEQERKAWNNIVADTEHGFNDAEMRKRLISKLIKSRFLSSECKYEHLLYVNINKNLTTNIFEADGRCSSFSPYLEKGPCFAIYSFDDCDQSFCLKEDLGKQSAWKHDGLIKSIKLTQEVRKNTYAKAKGLENAILCHTDTYSFLGSVYHNHFKLPEHFLFMLKTNPKDLQIE